MHHSLRNSDLRHLLGYIADLEFEVDRLRRQSQFVQAETRAALRRIAAQCEQSSDAVTALADIATTTSSLTDVVRDLYEAPGYHPSHDQVVAIAVRPLIEQVFRSQQRLLGATGTILRLRLEEEFLDWFPGRLRHIIDNLLSNSLRFRDAAKSEQWIEVVMRPTPEGYEFRVSDNGLGLPPGQEGELLSLLYRAAPTRATSLGVGLAVVKLLVERSGGSLAFASSEGQGTAFTLFLPRYEVGDFLF